jgi:hypothetical protein
MRVWRHDPTRDAVPEPAEPGDLVGRRAVLVAAPRLAKTRPAHGWLSTTATGPKGPLLFGAPPGDECRAYVWRCLRRASTRPACLASTSLLGTGAPVGRAPKRSWANWASRARATGYGVALSDCCIRREWTSFNRPRQRGLARAVGQPTRRKRALTRPAGLWDGRGSSTTALGGCSRGGRHHQPPCGGTS